MGTTEDAEDAADGIVQKCLPRGFYSSIIFNDTPGRKLSEILALYDRAIAKAQKPQPKVQR